MKKMYRKSTIIFLSTLFLIISGCTSVSQPLHTKEKGHYAHLDPYQRYNRAMFKFNEKFDKYFAKPIATFYIKVVPRPLSKGVTNALSNLSGIPTVFNDLLQFRFYQATSDAWRFGVNSTIGIGGFFDVATPMHLPPNRQNFSMTLARWGWRDSNYFVMPFLGPSTVRGTVSLPVDWLTSSYYQLFFVNNKVLISLGLIGLKLVDSRAQLLRYQNVFQQVSLDPYIFVRNAYLQRQAYQIKLNNEPVKHVSPWGPGNQLWILY